MPIRVPRFIASDVPIMLIPSSILLQILTTWPDPTGPQWTTLAPITERRSCAAGNTSGGPPTINVSWPNLAAFTPPDTGASMNTFPCASANAATVLDACGSTVLLSISKEPFFPDFKIPFFPLYTSSIHAVFGNIVMTQSTCAATSCGLCDTAAPSCFNESSVSCWTS